MPENPKSQRDQFIDNLLDASLREYSRTEPRIGLENRILRRIEEAPPQRFWMKTFWMTGWRWSAVAVVAVLIVSAVLLLRPHVPPPNRAPRFNQTIPASGVNPNLGNGVRPVALPPCKPGEEPKSAAKKSTQDTQESTKSKSKVSEDCVPASSKQPQPAPAPHK
jgi:hypothetical protein